MVTKAVTTKKARRVRPKRVHVLGIRRVLGGPPTPAERAAVWAGIAALLSEANRLPPNTRGAGELERALTGALDGQTHFELRGWPLTLTLAFYNLLKITRAGAKYHLQRCRECRHWFLADDARRRACYRRDCSLRAGWRQSSRRKRLKEQTAQREALEAVRLKPTKRQR